MFSKPVDDHFVRLDNHRQASSGCLVIAAKLLKLANESSMGLLLLIIAGIVDAEHIALFISKVLLGVLIEKPQKLPYILLRLSFLPRFKKVLSPLKPLFVLFVDEFN